MHFPVRPVGESAGFARGSFRSDIPLLCLFFGFLGPGRGYLFGRFPMERGHVGQDKRIGHAPIHELLEEIQGAFFPERENEICPAGIDNEFMPGERLEDD